MPITPANADYYLGAARDQMADQLAAMDAARAALSRGDNGTAARRIADAASAMQRATFALSAAVAVIETPRRPLANELVAMASAASDRELESLPRVGRPEIPA